MSYIQTYKVIYKKKEISLYQERNGKFKVMRHKGEEFQPYQYEHFWSWWKEKSEYILGESVHFIIETDDNNFKIHESITVVPLPPTSQEIIEELAREKVKSIMPFISKTLTWSKYEASKLQEKSIKGIDKLKSYLSEIFNKSKALKNKKKVEKTFSNIKQERTL